jgi:hypothetical protein
VKTEIHWCRVVVTSSYPTLVYVSSIANQTFFKDVVMCPVPIKRKKSNNFKSSITTK